MAQDPPDRLDPADDPTMDAGELPTADGSEAIDPADAPTAAGSEAPTMDASDLPTTDGSDAPDWISGYRILGKLGEGGMGVVFEAEQQSPRRRVALKVVRGGQFIDANTVRMFQREAESLARLKHPNIAGIYESGCTDDGLHFFAMELVSGETLGAHMRALPERVTEKDLESRLRLFRQIAEAVQYAHQRGVIHRDLKPGNVIVSDQPISGGGSGSIATGPQVKILDFGLARITDADVAAATMQTEVGIIKGTLPYMSPEQARGVPDEIDLRTDVYALGVILYQMLTGDYPYDTQRTSLIEAVRVICEEPPSSVRKNWSGVRKLDDDIETIVGKALEKDVEQRYDSAAALAEDIGRYLEQQPILARPPTTGYQLRKLVARNKLATATLAGVLVGLIGFGVAMGVLWRKSEIARARAEASKLVAMGQLRLEDYSTAALAHATKSLEVADSDEGRRLALEALWKGPPVFRLDLHSGMPAAFHPDGTKLLQGRFPLDNGIFRVVNADGSTVEFDRLLESRMVGAGWTADPDRFLSLDPFTKKGYEVHLWSASERRILGRRHVPTESTYAWNVEHEGLVVLTPVGKVYRSALADDGKTTALGSVSGFPSTRTLARDGTWIGSVNGDEIEVRDVGQDALSTPRSVGQHAGVTSLAVLEQSRYVATRDDSGEVRIWDTRGDEAPRSTAGPEGKAQLAFDEDGKFLTLVLAVEDGSEIWVAALAGEEPVWRNTGSHSLSDDAIVDSVGNQVVFPSRSLHWMPLGGPDGTQPIELQNGRSAQRNYFSYTPDGHWLADTVGGLSLYYLNRPYSMAVDVSPGWGFEFGSHGEWAAFPARLGRHVGVKILPLIGALPEPERVLVELPPGPRITTLESSPDGRLLLIGTGRTGAPGPILVDLESGEQHILPDGYRDQIVGIAFSQDGRRVAAAGGQFLPDENVVKVWDVETRELVAVHDPERTLSHNAVGFTADGDVLWCGGAGLWRWNVETGEQRQLLGSETNSYVRTFSVGDGGRRVLAVMQGEGSGQRNLMLVDTDSGDALPLLEHGETVESARLSADGTIVASADTEGVIRVGPADASPPHLLFGHQGSVLGLNGVAIDPLGRWVVSTGRNETRFWPMPDMTGTPLHLLDYDDLLTRLRSLTNVRLIEDPEDRTGYSLSLDPFPGWNHDPVW